MKEENEHYVMLPKRDIVATNRRITINNILNDRNDPLVPEFHSKRIFYNSMYGSFGSEYSYDNEEANQFYEYLIKHYE